MEVILEEIRRVPVVTRTYAILCLAITAACQLGLVSPLSLYFAPQQAFVRMQVCSTPMSSLICFIVVAGAYNFPVLRSSGLEESSFRDRTGDFVYMFVFGCSFMLILGSWLKILFLGQALNSMIVYVWSRRNRHQRLNFFGIVTITAPYLPYLNYVCFFLLTVYRWFLMGISFLFGADVTMDIIGIVVGHVYYYLEDVYPRMTPSRTRLLKTPEFFNSLFTNQAH